MTRASPAIVVVALAAALACGVTRRSPVLACSATSQCSGGRTCVQGYCVLAAADARPDTPVVCPSQCTTCDIAQMSCTIVGGNNITCPTGWSCTVDCTRANSCGMVNCDGATSCTLMCAGASTCGDVTCGTGACDVQCTGTSSCQVVDCRASCRCNTTCTGSGACNSLQCPRINANQFCTTNGSDGQPCSSSFDVQCAQC